MTAGDGLFITIQTSGAVRRTFTNRFHAARREFHVTERDDEFTRHIAPDQLDEDRALDATLRPETLDEFVGQEKLKERLILFIEAARQRGDALDHVASRAARSQPQRPAVADPGARGAAGGGLASVS